MTKFIHRTPRCVSYVGHVGNSISEQTRYYNSIVNEIHRVRSSRAGTKSKEDEKRLMNMLEKVGSTKCINARLKHEVHKIVDEMKTKYR